MEKKKEKGSVAQPCSDLQQPLIDDNNLTVYMIPIAFSNSGDQIRMKCMTEFFFLPLKSLTVAPTNYTYSSPICKQIQLGNEFYF